MKNREEEPMQPNNEGIPLRRPLRTHRRLFWPAGLLSLALLPLAVSWHIARSPLAREQSTIEVNMDHAPETWTTSLRYREAIASNGSWHLFEFTGNEYLDSSVFVASENAVRAHVAQNDTINGIRIHFARTARYSDFVRVLDMLDMQNATRRAYIGPEFWVLRCLSQSEQAKLPTSQFGMWGGCIVFSPTSISQGRQYIQSSEQFFIFYGMETISNGMMKTLFIPLFLGWAVIGIMNIRRIRGLAVESRKL